MRLNSPVRNADTLHTLREESRALRDNESERVQLTFYFIFKYQIFGSYLNWMPLLMSRLGFLFELDIFRSFDVFRFATEIIVSNNLLFLFSFIIKSLCVEHKRHVTSNEYSFFTTFLSRSS